MIHVLVSLFSLLPHQYEIAYLDTSINVEIERIEFQDYLPLKPIAGLLGLHYVQDHKTQRLMLSAGDKTLAMIGDISMIACNGTMKHLPFPPLFIKGDIYFPAGEIIPTLGGIFDRLIFIEELKEAPLIKDIALFTRGDSTILKFQWEKEIDFDVQYLVKKVIVEIDGQYKKTDGLKPTGAVTSSKVGRFNTYTSLEFDVEGINAYMERGNEVIFFHKVSKQVHLIVIDPGHGGVDPGAVGKKGLYEKDANLGIALFLRDYITDSLNIKVIMTRDQDKYLSLKARTNFANRNSADLFISIHCNASGKSAKMTGFETYFLSGLYAALTGLIMIARTNSAKADCTASSALASL